MAETAAPLVNFSRFLLCSVDIHHKPDSISIRSSTNVIEVTGVNVYFNIRE
jgi:hypothetical protein